MIKAVMVISTHGKPRLSKFYDFQPAEKQQQIIRQVYAVLSRRPDSVSNFVQVESIFGQGTGLVYKHYATLYFVLVFDSSENELAMLDLIQVFVETLDKCFGNVCELDLIFNYNKMQTIVDEIICGGQVLETNSMEIMQTVEEITKLEMDSSSNTLISRTISSWRGEWKIDKEQWLGCRYKYHECHALILAVGMAYPCLVGNLYVHSLVGVQIDV